MNWTKTPPTRAGVYLFQPKYGKPEAVLLYQNQHDYRLYQEGQNYSADSWDGQWSGPLVSVEEVEKAYREGFGDGSVCFSEDASPEKYVEANFEDSRAHKIVEGKL